MDKSHAGHSGIRRLGAWNLIAEGPSGGNGTVWEAKHDDGTPAIIKVLKQQSRSGDRLQRFQDEIKVLTDLSGHPGVMPILDYNVPAQPSRPNPAWYAMPVAVPIKAHLSGANIYAVVAALAQIAATLAELSGHSIHHRDIKPENLFWLNGRAVIGDWGLVDMPGKVDITEEGRRLGPLFYMAPEMLSNAATAESGPADVYSLAKTLWVLVTEQTYPLPGQYRLDTPQLLLSVILDDPRLRTLDRLLDRATALEPCDRPSKSEFHAELSALLAPRAEGSVLPDMNDLAARLRAASAPRLKSVADMEALRNIAIDAYRQFGALLKDVQRELIAQGFESVEFDSQFTVPNVSELFRSVEPGGSESLARAEDVLVITVPTSVERTHKLALVAGSQVFNDGGLVLVCAAILFTARPRAITDVKMLWTDLRDVPAGSSQQEVAISEMVQRVRASLQDGITELVVRTENADPQ